MDPYKILGISKDASQDEIRRAYRRMAAKYHPDQGGDAWIFQQVEAAYAQLCGNIEPHDDVTDSAEPAPEAPKPSGDAPRHRDAWEKYFWIPIVIGGLILRVLGWETFTAIVFWAFVVSLWLAVVAGIAGAIYFGYSDLHAKQKLGRSFGSLLFAAAVLSLLIGWGYILSIVAWSIALGLAIASGWTGYLAANNTEEKRRLILTVGAIGIGFTSFCLLMSLIVRSGDTTVSGGDTAGRPTPVSYPTLSPTATTEQITTAYQPRVFFIAVSFTEHRRKQGLFGLYVEQASRAGYGSGIMIANDTSTGLILTNRHVVEPDFEDSNSRISNRVVRVKNSLQSSFVEARVVAVHVDHDLALLLVDQTFDTSESIRVILRWTPIVGQRLGLFKV